MPSLDVLMPLAPWLLLILAAEFVNGWTDAPNAIATVVSTQVMRPHHAVLMAAVLNAAGAFAGTAVATTIGKGIIRPEMVDIQTVGAAMMGIVVWSTIAWYYGLPTSESHGLVAGLTGAGLAAGGWDAVQWEGWRKTLIGIGFSTFLGFFVGMALMIAIYWIARRWKPGTVRRVFGRLQVGSAAFMAFSHGSNDGQKFMGVFTLALMLGGVLHATPGNEFPIPFWVILMCAVVMGIGTMVGGWRIIKTMGLQLTKLEPVHGFAAETAAGVTIMTAGAFGIPLSTTHTITTSIMGVGSTRGLSAVRWGVAGGIVAAWILTFPICGLIAYVTTLIVR
jgi:inorganic phosphate transporter, PiT family